MKQLFLILTACLSFALSPAAAQIIQVKPVDEGPQVPGFAQYRADFLDAVRARDIARMLDFVSTDVHLSFGGDEGHAAFIQFLTRPEDLYSPEYRHLAKKHRAEYWAALEDVLTLGGQFKDGKTAFSAPYTWAVDIDLPQMFTPYETYFVMGSDVPLRAGRSGLSRVIATMDHEVLLLDFNELDGKEKRFLKVTRGNGQQGYVRADQVTAAVGYRARFERDGSSWKMVMFLAGD
ncbi:hypothetical protein [Aestuariivita boseongensis]|uniref:hypothetical protein n=1 Tax=Aestuariivita boseongensis TaxID=1470562 RepID=UPI000682C3CD|nr:hypothetical protein [Aestuariivita boseongensis]